MTEGLDGAAFWVVLRVVCRRCHRVRAQLWRNESGEVGWYTARFRNRCECARELPDPVRFAIEQAGRIDRERRRGHGPVPVERPGPVPNAPFTVTE